MPSSTAMPDVASIHGELHAQVIDADELSELGGACYFEPITAELSDWMPTHEHFPLSKREGGKVAVDNAILAHRLCNRIDYSISVGRSFARDLKGIRKAVRTRSAATTNDRTP